MKALSGKELLSGLHQLGIGRGDDLLVHSGLTTLGEIAGGPETFLKTLREAIGDEGTLIMPTFNFDILKDDPIVFDVRNTPSKMGVLSELFRTLPGTVRGHHLFHPWAYNGPLASFFLDCPNVTDWGEDSPLRLFYRKNVKVLLQGVDFNTCTLLHYCEYKCRVPYRYEYEFPNAFLVDEEGTRRKVRNRRYRHTGETEQDFNKLLPILEERGLVRGAIIGNSVCRLMEAQALIETTLSKMTVDPYYFTRQETLLQRVPVMRGQVDFSPKKLIAELWQENRALVSDGFVRSLEKIGEIVPLRIRKYPSGSEVWTWIIPRKWSIGEAYIEAGGGRLVDIKKSLLHVVIGSAPVDREVSHEELMKHIHVDDRRPEAIPYVWQYYKEDWGFCVRKNDLKAFTYPTYRVYIDASLEPGELAVGEYDLPGFKDDVIVFPIHLDHPAQCNDNLSGVAAALVLIDMLQRRFLKYTYKFLFLPETIGSIAYLANNKELIPKMKYCIVLDTVGHRNSLFFQKTFNGTEKINTVFSHVMWRNLEEHRELKWRELDEYGNDERMFDVPFIRIPSISVSRFPYPEYHSDLDNPGIIHDEMITGAAQIVFKVIDILERDFIPRQRYDGIPFLGRFGLYVEYRDDPWACLARDRAIYYLDGNYSVFDIAEKIGVPFDTVYDFCMEMSKKHLIDIIDIKDLRKDEQHVGNKQQDK